MFKCWIALSTDLKLKFAVSTGQRSIDWSSIIHLLDNGVKQERMNSLLGKIIRETSIFVLPMKWVHLVERDDSGGNLVTRVFGLSGQRD